MYHKNISPKSQLEKGFLELISYHLPQPQPEESKNPDENQEPQLEFDPTDGNEKEGIQEVMDDPQAGAELD